MTERAAIRAVEGMLSRPTAHLDFRETREFLTQSGVVGDRDRVGVEGKPREARLGEKMEELTEAKWLLRVLAMEVESDLNEDQVSDGVEEVASFRVFQIAEGCEFLLKSRWKYSIFALRCNQTTRFRWALKMLLEAAEGLQR